MSYPTPVWSEEKQLWELDLRSPWKLGRHVVRAPEPPFGLVEAIHKGRDIFDRLRDARAPQPQMTLPGVDVGTFAELVRRYEYERETNKEMAYRKEGGRRWVLECDRALCLFFGQYELGAFEPPQGTRLILRYRNWLRGEPDAETGAPFVLPGRDRKPVGPRTCQDRLGQLAAILRWASLYPRQWLRALPTFPPAKVRPGEKLHHPISDWRDEATFRAARAALYEDPVARRALGTTLRVRKQACDAAAVHDYICRRRLFLSFAFYTGMRLHDLSELSDRSVAPDFGFYQRHTRKTSGVDDEEWKATWEEAPRPLRADLEAERARLGRPYRRGELICGGPWLHPARPLREAGRRAGVDSFNLRDCRRSFVYHKALAGLDESELVSLLGHVDSRMIHEVYLRVPPRASRDRSGAAWPELATLAPGTGDARIIPFRRNEP
jgi:hypothetical protein